MTLPSLLSVTRPMEAYRKPLEGRQQLRRREIDPGCSRRLFLQVMEIGLYQLLHPVDIDRLQILQWFGEIDTPI